MSSRRPSHMLPRTPPKKGAESLPGYIVRLAEANGLEKLEWLPVTPESRSSLSFAHCVALDARALAELELMSGLTGGSLVGERWLPLESAAGPYIGIWGETLPLDAFMTSGAQICPLCLDAQEPFLHADWDFSLVTVCTHHHCWLVAECAACAAPLRWSRPRMLACSHCGFDLRRSKTRPCANSEVEVADFVAAVARFNFAGKATSLEPPEALFEMGRLLSLTRDDFLAGRQQRAFSRLYLAKRHAAASRLASCIVERAVAGQLVHRQLLAHVAHIESRLGTARAKSRLRRFLAGNDFLDVPVHRYLALAGEDEVIAQASDLFQGRPPQLFSQAQALAFIGCNEDEFDAAMADGLVRSPTQGLAFDLDELLAVRRRLEALLSERDVDQSFEVDGLCAALLRLNVLRSDRRPNRPPAISEEHFERVLDRLVEVSAPREALPPDAVNLGNALPQIDADSLALLISLVMSGGVGSFSWEAPWGWQQMSVDAMTWKRLSS